MRDEGDITIEADCDKLLRHRGMGGVSQLHYCLWSYHGPLSFHCGLESEVSATPQNAVSHFAHRGRSHDPDWVTCLIPQRVV